VGAERNSHPELFGFPFNTKRLIIVALKGFDYCCRRASIKLHKAAAVVLVEIGLA
jgi:hypothetical protein